MATIADLLGTRAQDLACSARYAAQQAALEARKQRSWAKRTAPKAQPQVHQYRCDARPVTKQAWPLKHICQDWLSSKLKVECPACRAESASCKS